MTTELEPAKLAARGGGIWITLGSVGLLLALTGLASLLVSSGTRTADAQERLTAAHERVAAVEEASASVLYASTQASRWTGTTTEHALSTPILEATLAADLDRHGRILAAAQIRFPPSHR